MERNTLIIIIALSAIVVVFSGCNANSSDVAETASDDVLGELNSHLENGPVLLVFESDNCPACRLQETTLEEVEPLYADTVYFMRVNVNEHQDIASDFGIYYIPDTTIFLTEENGVYSYMGSNGEVSTDRRASRWVGATDAQSISSALDLALDYRNSMEE